MGRGTRFGLPPGVPYRHDEFIAFLSVSDDELECERSAEASQNYKISKEMFGEAKLIEERSKIITGGMEVYKPVGGFPKVSSFLNFRCFIINK
ncbi:unnamed protein product [Protopolystoma xenopodis]|uniref:Uncharacterized protein n=1 Tax=Protopolystoma xenopodis TaxID=117903 RepID=A0A3S5ARY9_9PLAT|nr:unnamed protein product [Protopolystoma xenopodis]